jgi:hypothetical protein
MFLDVVSSLEHCTAHASSGIHKLGTSTVKLLHEGKGASLDNVHLLLTAIYRDFKNVRSFTSRSPTVSRGLLSFSGVPRNFFGGGVNKFS